MNKKAFVILNLVFMSFLFSRDDPFVPLIVPKDSIRPYYGESSVFEKEEIRLPSNARLIKKIAITYQNIDGSIETKSIDVSGRIDWRMPILISQIFNNKDYKNSNLEDSSKTPKSTKISSASKNIAKNSIYKVENNNLFIEYDGDLLRSFIMKNPDRIVLDFALNLKYYKKNKIILNKPYFKTIRYGLHSDFIRIVVELDGSYIYKTSKINNGLLVNVE